MGFFVVVVLLLCCFVLFCFLFVFGGFFSECFFQVSKTKCLGIIALRGNKGHLVNTSCFDILCDACTCALVVIIILSLCFRHWPTFDAPYL